MNKLINSKEILKSINLGPPRFEKLALRTASLINCRLQEMQNGQQMKEQTWFTSPSQCICSNNGQLMSSPYYLKYCLLFPILPRFLTQNVEFNLYKVNVCYVTLLGI